MNTPICDFVRSYAAGDTLRLHMPGHKGVSLLGMERLDITEIRGADSLYEAEGIIAESEANASRLFGCPTFYSTEGSSLCIRAMLYLCVLKARAAGKQPRILAGRNAHKVFLSAAALLDFDVEWLWPEEGSYLSCATTPERLALEISRCQPTAVYLTSPDYLGNVVDIAAISQVCHRNGVLLVVDNAHGAYLRFLTPSRHPMDLGADLCCDSAHKTLPVLTGGAYLHVKPEFAPEVKNAMALFGSTSPSYLILQSLDAVNPYLENWPVAGFAQRVERLKENLPEYEFLGDEPLKLTIDAKAHGYTGDELADLLRDNGIECEFSDPDLLVLMLTPEVGEAGLRKLETALHSIPRREKLLEKPPLLQKPEQVLSIRQAMFSPRELVPAEQSIGRVLAAATVGCPPAVPILVCGERIDENAVECFRYYGIDSLCVTQN